MLIAIWILSVLLIAAIWCCIRFYDSIEQLERKLDANRSRLEGLVAEVNYWVAMYDNYHTRYSTTVNALYNVTALGTDNMANIGQRMSKTAQAGIDAAKQLTFVKA